MFRRPSIVAFVLVLLCPAAHAGDNAPSSQARELARLVLPESKYNEMLHNVAEATEKTLEAQAKEGEHLPPHFAERFEVEIRQMLQYPDLIEQHAKLIASHYTAREIKELIAFYRTPLGQKSVEVMPQIMAQWTAYVQQQMQAGMPAALQRIFGSKQASPAEKKADGQ